MPDGLKEAFEAKAEDWEAYTRTAEGRLREELNWRYLVQHLPAPDQARRVLDAGAGTGGLAIRLAQRGHDVCALDIAAGMLRRAADRAQQAGVEARLTFQVGRVEDVGDYFPRETFDVVVCHTLLEYVSEPELAVQALARQLRPAGIFSLAYVNRHSDALRLALAKGDLVGAREALTATSSQAVVLSVARRTFDGDAIREMLAGAGIQAIAEYGVRIFADYLAGLDWEHAPAVFDELVALETAAAPQFPYCLIGRYGQTIGRKAG